MTTSRDTEELAALREAIDQELEMMPPEKDMDQFHRGAASAYNYVLSHWPRAHHSDEGLRERIAALRQSVRFVDRRSGEDVTTDDIFAALAATPSEPEKER